MRKRIEYHLSPYGNKRPLFDEIEKLLDRIGDLEYRLGRKCLELRSAEDHINHLYGRISALEEAQYDRHIRPAVDYLSQDLFVPSIKHIDGACCYTAVAYRDLRFWATDGGPQFGKHLVDRISRQLAAVIAEKIAPVLAEAAKELDGLDI